MGYFQVRYDSRVVIYNRRAFTRLATGRGSSNDGVASVAPVFFAQNCHLIGVQYPVLLQEDRASIPGPQLAERLVQPEHRNRGSIVGLRFSCRYKIRDYYY